MMTDDDQPILGIYQKIVYSVTNLVDPQGAS